MKYLFALIISFLFILPESFAQSDSLFPVIDGWKKGEEKIYTSGTLYNAINGGSELFLNYNFIEMHRLEYSQNENYITVEIYKHATPIDAFGVYSRERPNKDIYFEIGVQGYKEHDYIHFLADQNYIKIRTYEPNVKSMNAMEVIANKLAKDLNSGAVYPELFSVFPLKGKVAYSDKYYNENILGYAFLKHSYEAEYEIENQSFVLFILKGEGEAEAKKMLEDYLSFLNISESTNSEGVYSFKDRYNGNIQILKHGKSLICCRGGLPEEKSKALLRDIAKKLE